MTPEQLQQIEQARRYAEQDEYVVTRTHIRNLLAIIDGQRSRALLSLQDENSRAALCVRCWQRSHGGQCVGSPSLTALLSGITEENKHGDAWGEP